MDSVKPKNKQALPPLNYGKSSSKNFERSSGIAFPDIFAKTNHGYYVVSTDELDEIMCATDINTPPDIQSCPKQAWVETLPDESNKSELTLSKREELLNARNKRLQARYTITGNLSDNKTVCAEQINARRHSLSAVTHKHTKITLEPLVIRR